MVDGLSNNLAIIIQARMTSNRLPCKIALDLCGKTVLERVIDQCKKVNTKSDIILATSDKISDDLTVKIAERSRIKIYRGSLNDVRSRYLNAGKGYKIITRVTADNPFTEPSFIDEAVKSIKNNNLDYASILNCPYGSGVQVFKYDLLRKTCNHYNDSDSKEHVMLEKLLIGDCKVKSYFYKSYPTSKKHIRLTIDTLRDYIVAYKIYNKLIKQNLENNLENVMPIWESIQIQ